MAQRSDPIEWDPFTVWRTTVIDLRTVRWSLSAAPDPQLDRGIRDAPTKKSGSAHLASGSEPTVSVGDIEWKVGPDDHLDANLRVHEKVDVANGVYPRGPEAASRRTRSGGGGDPSPGCRDRGSAAEAGRGERHRGLAPTRNLTPSGGTPSRATT